MIDVGVTKMSTKGQIVIPSDLRSEFEVGEKLIVIKNEDQLIIKKASSLDKNLEEDLEFARRTEEAWKRYEKGEFESLSEEDFLKELEKC
jgi:AbrB family looped-hinge helix DNA binding protein